ncbi:50S ribosomal protein L12P domain protein [Cooperia oncophora]
MIVLAMYLNTLLFVALHYKALQIRRRAATTVATAYGAPTAPAEPQKVEEKKSDKRMRAFIKYEEAKTQTQEQVRQCNPP